MIGTVAPRYVWLSPEYSVLESTLCTHRPQSPNADFRCIRAAGHRGKHLTRWCGDAPTRDYSHTDKRP